MSEKELQIIKCEFIRINERRRCLNNHKRRDINLIVDEIANIPKIQNINKETLEKLLIILEPRLNKEGIKEIFSILT